MHSYSYLALLFSVCFAFAARPTALHFDVEFHILPEGVPALVGDWLDLMQKLKNITGDTVKIHSDVPFGLSGISNYWKYEGKPIGTSLLEIIDGVVVMSYRDSASGVIELTNGFFPITNKKIWSSVETQFIRGEGGITFFEEGERVMEDALVQVRDTLSEQPHWAGLLVHYDTSYRAMGEKSGLIPEFPRGMWVWYNSVQIVQNATFRQDFLQFCEEKKINLLLMESTSIVLNEDLLVQFKEFINDAHAQGIEVEMLFGDPTWSYQENHHIAMDLATRSMNFINSIVD